MRARLGWVAAAMLAMGLPAAAQDAVISPQVKLREVVEGMPRGER